MWPFMPLALFNSLTDCLTITDVYGSNLTGFGIFNHFPVRSRDKHRNNILTMSFAPGGAVIATTGT